MHIENTLSEPMFCTGNSSVFVRIQNLRLPNDLECIMTIVFLGVKNVQLTALSSIASLHGQCRHRCLIIINAGARVPGLQKQHPDYRNQ